MNNKKAKRLRRKSEEEVYHWYRSLLPEEHKDQLTPELALEYTPEVDYWTEFHECYHPKIGEYTSRQIRVSEGTKRWFYLQEKKNARRAS